jgi:hypothetical protein
MFQNLKVECGFTPQLFQLLKSMSAAERCCTISFDEVALSFDLAYDKCADKIIGFEDYGCLGSSKNLANHSLVFMATGLLSGWKQPIGSFTLEMLLLLKFFVVCSCRAWICCEMLDSM